jgi:hypothetical protein
MTFVLQQRLTMTGFVVAYLAAMAALVALAAPLLTPIKPYLLLWACLPAGVVGVAMIAVARLTRTQGEP